MFEEKRRHCTARRPRADANKNSTIYKTFIRNVRWEAAPRRERGGHAPSRCGARARSNAPSGTPLGRTRRVPAAREGRLLI